MSSPAVAATGRIEPGFVRQRAADLVRQGKGARVLLLHGLPHWDGEPSMIVEGHTVHVRAGVSQLAILDAYANLPEDDYLVVVTDRTRQDLGDAVLLQAWHREIQLPDLWGALPALFGAHDTARDLRRAGAWVPSALLTHTPPTGWPVSPGPEVTAEFALGNLVASLLGLPLPESLDADLVLSRLGDARTRVSWQSVEASLRGHLVTWTDEHVGAAVAFALRCAEQGSAVAPLALALAVDVLWNEESGGRSASARGVAAGRLIERHLGGHPLTPDDAHEVARAGRAAISRHVVTEPETARNLLAQAEALLGDLGWPEGAAASDLLPAGLSARLRGLGTALDEGAPAAEAALQRLLQHLLAGPDSHDVLTARMAVRLARWRATAEDTTDTLSASLRRQLDDGAWVDRALTLVWNGSDDPELSAHYAGLVTAVQKRRFERDRVAAGQLAQQTGHPISLEAAVPIEDLLSQVVKPWSSGNGVLLVVLDGMSAAVATEVAEGAGELGFAEWVPQSGRRLCALSVLPSLTSLSRASLFAGALGEGGPAVEKRAFDAAFPGAPLFHKNDLRADAGAQLPPEVVDAIATDSIPVVGVVINTIDDTLHKQDPSSMRWTLERLAPLRALLSEAVAAGRAVVLTSDHGHVIERASQARSLPGASARWRSESAGPVSDGEVLLAGTRVLTDGGRAVLLWREDVHYGPRQTGYHGGASLAEVTVPVIVLQPALHSGGTVPSPAGWAQAAPQAPEWWNEPARHATSRAPAPRRTVPVAHPVGRPNEGPTLFELGTAGRQDATEGDLVDAVLASTTYSAQKTRAGRRSADDATVAAILRALLQRGNRAHRDTLATAGGVPATAIESTLAAVKRLVNVDGYAILEQDADLVTLKLDVDLLRDQFGVGS